MRISEFRNHLKRAIGKGEKNAFIRKNKYNYCVHFMRSSNEKNNAFIQKNKYNYFVHFMCSSNSS